MHELNAEQIEVLKALFEANALNETSGFSAEQISQQTGKLASDLLDILHDLYTVHMVIGGVHDIDPSGHLHNVSEAPWWLLPDGLASIERLLGIIRD